MSLFCVAAPAVVEGKVTSGMIRISIEKFNSVDFIAEEIGFYLYERSYHNDMPYHTIPTLEKLF